MTISCPIRWLGFAAFVLFVLVGTSASSEDSRDPVDSTMTLRGGEEGTIFKSLRIEGEDRVRIEFDRPVLELGLDARTAPGLDFEIVRAALVRNDYDLVAPFVNGSAVTRGPLFARPWFDKFVSGNVVRFRPALEGVERWRLDVADSRGNTVMSYEGSGSPPKEIGWDGRTIDGGPAPPGLTYSYVLEAYDRAGNKRNFVGDGFDLPPYIVQDKRRFALLFAGHELARSAPSNNEGGSTAPILLEAATRINQSTPSRYPIRVEVTARSFDEAKRAADLIVGHLAPLLLGDPLRIQPIATVEPDAPHAGTVRIEVGMQ